MGKTKTQCGPILQLMAAVLILLGALLTTPVWDDLGGHAGGERPQPEDERDGSRAQSSPLTLRDTCRDIDSRPLAQRNLSARQYCGVKVTGEPLWLEDIAEDPEAGVFRLFMTVEAKREDPYSAHWIIACDVDRILYPELIGAREGLGLYVSGEIQAIERHCIELTNVSLVFGEQAAPCLSGMRGWQGPDGLFQIRSDR